MIYQACKSRPDNNANPLTSIICSFKNDAHAYQWRITNSTHFFQLLVRRNTLFRRHLSRVVMVFSFFIRECQSAVLIHWCMQQRQAEKDEEMKDADRKDARERKRLQRDRYAVSSRPCYYPASGSEVHSWRVGESGPLMISQALHCNPLPSTDRPQVLSHSQTRRSLVGYRYLLSRLCCIGDSPSQMNSRWLIGC